MQASSDHTMVLGNKSPNSNRQFTAKSQTVSELLIMLDKFGFGEVHKADYFYTLDVCWIML
jgi:hypothetical protein